MTGSELRESFGDWLASARASTMDGTAKDTLMLDCMRAFMATWDLMDKEAFDATGQEA